MGTLLILLFIYIGAMCIGTMLFGRGWRADAILQRIWFCSCSVAEATGGFAALACSMQERRRILEMELNFLMVCCMLLACTMPPRCEIWS